MSEDATDPFLKTEFTGAGPSVMSSMFDTEDPNVKKNLRTTGWRWIILVLGCLLCFGSYFCYDNPSALQPQIMDKLNINAFEFNMLYSVYSFPNIILPLFGGYLIDYIGIRFSIILFSTLLTAGQAIFAIGCSAGNYPIAILGRFVFGLGGESLNVGQSTVVVNWFRGQELAMALGANVGVSRIGSVLNDFTEPQMYEATGSIDFGLWVGFGICVGALICGIVLVSLDKRADILMGIKGKATLDPSERVKLSDVKYFDRLYWLITINCCVVYICVLTFNNIASGFFQDRFGWSSTEAGMIIAITYLISALFSPFLGSLIDKIGKRCYFMILSAFLMFCAHITFVFLPDWDQCIDNIPILVLLGIGYALYASVMWASIPLVVDPKTVGTAFGLTTAVQNIGLGFSPLIVGAIIDNTSKDHGYFWASVFFACCGVVGMITGFFILCIDNARGGVLNKVDKRLGESALLEGEDGDLTVSHPEDEEYPEHVKQLLVDPKAREAVKKSLGKGSFANR